MITRIILFLSLTLISCGIAFGQSGDTSVFTTQGGNGGFNQAFTIGNGSFLGVFTEDNDKGVVVTSVIKDSPADKAGLKKDDIILGFDNDQVTSVRKLNRLISEAAPGQDIKLTISRGGSNQTVSVKMGKRQDFPQVFNYTINNSDILRQSEDARRQAEALRDQMQRNGPNGWFAYDNGQVFFGPNGSRRIGVTTTELSEQLAEFFGVKEKHGLLIQTVTENSPASKAGLKAGDVITDVDSDKVETMMDLSRAINRKEDGEIKITIVRNKNPMTVNVTPEKRPQPKPGTSYSYSYSTPDSELYLPSFSIPVIPEINLPEIAIPSIHMPDIRIAPLTYRRLATPTLRYRTITVPTIKGRFRLVSSQGILL